MTTIADLNDKWAAYAGPGGWNGTLRPLYSICEYLPTFIELGLMVFGRSGYVRSWERWHDLPGISSTFQHLGFDEGII